MQEQIQKIDKKSTKQLKIANTYILPDMQYYFSLGQVSGNKCSFCRKDKHTIEMHHTSILWKFGEGYF